MLRKEICMQITALMVFNVLIKLIYLCNRPLRCTRMIKKYLPNFFTLLNLLMGGIGALLAMRGHLTKSALCVWMGMVFDFIDGWLARLLQVDSPLGKQLDSFADLITFGWLPASIVYQLIDNHVSSPYLPYIALLIPIFSALRLARFNIDLRPHSTFMGLPTPANGVFISTLPLIIMSGRHAWLTALLCNPYTLSVLVVISSWLLVSNIEFMSFKITTYDWYPNRFRYGFLFVASMCILFLDIAGLALSVILYILVSPLTRYWEDQ